MAAEDLRAKLADAGARRTAAMTAKAQASSELAKLIPRAARAGVPPTEIAQLTGMSRQGVYELTHRRK